jgi:hypothetical protein
MHVGGRHEPVRLHRALDEDVLPVRLLRGLQETEALAGDGVVDHISLADHRVPFTRICSDFS